MEIKFAELLTPNPCPFDHPFQWRFRIESFLPAPAPIDIAFVWVGSSRSNEHDIVLDEYELGNVMPGQNEFTLEHFAPDITQIPTREDLFGMTVMTVTFSIAGQPFTRIAYLVSVGAFGEMSDSIKSGNSQPPIMGDNPEEQKKAILSVLGRNVVADKPRLTAFPVENWGGFVWNDGDGKFHAVQQGDDDANNQNNNENNNNNNNASSSASAAAAASSGNNDNNNNNNGSDNNQQRVSDD